MLVQLIIMLIFKVRVCKDLIARLYFNLAEHLWQCIMPNIGQSGDMQILHQQLAVSFKLSSSLVQYDFKGFIGSLITELREALCSDKINKVYNLYKGKGCTGQYLVGPLEPF